MEDCILQLHHITKEFPGVKALDDVNLDIKRGEVHALVGENGAGKSTLMKIISGEYTDYAGDLLWDGKKADFRGIKESEKTGITIIHQELGLVLSMNICENIFLGDEICTNGIINWDEEYLKCKKALSDLNLNLSPQTRVGNLGIGQQQLVEIAKALSKEVKLLILDEPTAPLTEKDSENLLDLVEDLKKRGITVIFISHKLGEVFRIADRITVLRDGKTISTRDKSDYTVDSLINEMVGRKLDNCFEPRDCELGETMLEVRDWSAFDGVNGKWILKDININVRAGEIIGLSGMIGAGRTELAMSIFGVLDYAVSGHIKLDGKEIQRFKNSKESIDAGVYYLTEDRKQYGLVLTSDIAYNSTLASLDKFQDNIRISHEREIAAVNQKVQELSIKTPSILQTVGYLSGGNQQKVCIAKALLTQPRVLILDEATRGIDIGAKTEIYKLINKMAEDGIAVIMISSELPEVLGMSDRIYVLREGEISAEFDNRERNITQEQIALAATGGMLV